MGIEGFEMAIQYSWRMEISTSRKLKNKRKQKSAKKNQNEKKVTPQLIKEWQLCP